jgi:hypothetical protein
MAACSIGRKKCGCLTLEAMSSTYNEASWQKDASSTRALHRSRKISYTGNPNNALLAASDIIWKMTGKNPSP